MNVAIIGCGVRGSIVAVLLAGGIVKELSLIDGGFVEADDIGRNPMLFGPDVRAGKADSLVAKLALINPDLLAIPFPADLDADNAEAILAGADVVVDCVGDAAISEAIARSAEHHGARLVGPPAGYEAALVSPARAVAVGAEQADRVLAAGE